MRRPITGALLTVALLAASFVTPLVVAAAPATALDRRGDVVGSLVAGSPEPGRACTDDPGTVYAAVGEVSARPGELLRCARVSPQVALGPPATGYLYSYVTEDAVGATRAGTGMLVVPRAPWRGAGPRPVIGYANGTVGAGADCAVSRAIAGLPAALPPAAAIGLTDLLNEGFAVAVVDGVGYREGEIHPYLVGETAGNAHIDGTLAAMALPGAGLSAEAPVGFRGYSEGGHTVLWAAELVRERAPQLRMAGVAAGGTPGDPRATAYAANGGLGAGFVAVTVAGLADTYPDLPLAELATPEGLTALDRVRRACVAEVVPAYAFDRIEDFTVLDSLDALFDVAGADGATWGDRVTQQRVGQGVGPGPGAQRTVDFPVLQYWGAFDFLIGEESLEYGARAYCEAGVPTQLRRLPAEHLSADILAGRAVASWLRDRFEGRPFTPDCRALS